MLTSGIYGLFRLDRASTDPADAVALGLEPHAVPGPAQALGIDPQAPSAVRRSDTGSGITLLVGELDEMEALAQRLGLAQSTPPADLARQALARFGADTPAVMLGEWSLLHWEAQGRLTLMSSAARRDPLFYAISGPRCAVAPELAGLARLPWVDDVIDPAGLLLSLGRHALRVQVGNRTVLADVRSVPPGGSVIIEPHGERHGTAALFELPPRFAGSFDEALEEAEALLRRIMQERFTRNTKPAILLSGGLDSSLLAWLAVEAGGAGAQLACITSAAPPGSGLPDETAFADAVANRLGIRTIHVAPPLDADTYRAPDHVLAGANGPMLSNRHCLTAAFQATAAAEGASLLVNGTYGEMSVTGRSPFLSVQQRLRRAGGRVKRRLFPPGDAASARNPFHVRFAPSLLAALPKELGAALAVAESPAEARLPGGQWGFEPGLAKAFGRSNLFHAGALRMDYPYRDLRLARLFASFPSSFMQRGRLDRAMARLMLAGRVPDSIRLRALGMPASPDHVTRLTRQAPAARDRIGAFRAAGIDAWIDCDWLDNALARTAATGPAGIDDANQVQLTALAGEFLLWWQDRR